MNVEKIREMASEVKIEVGSLLYVHKSKYCNKFIPGIITKLENIVKNGKSELGVTLMVQSCGLPVEACYTESYARSMHLEWLLNQRGMTIFDVT